eukprot:774634-Rhodomonas_salina.1
MGGEGAKEVGGDVAGAPLRPLSEERGISLGSAEARGGRVERESLHRRAEAATGMEEEERRIQGKISHPGGPSGERLS